MLSFYAFHFFGSAAIVLVFLALLCFLLGRLSLCNLFMLSVFVQRFPAFALYMVVNILCTYIFAMFFLCVRCMLL